MTNQFKKFVTKYVVLASKHNKVADDLEYTKNLLENRKEALNNKTLELHNLKVRVVNLERQLESKESTISLYSSMNSDFQRENVSYLNTIAKLERTKVDKNLVYGFSSLLALLGLFAGVSITRIWG